MVPSDVAPGDLAYIEKVRHATKRLSERGAEDVQGAIQALRGTAHFDIDAPTAVGRREVQLLKTGVKRVSSWYMRYLSVQLDAFAANMVRVGDTLAAKAERLEHTSYELSARLNAVEERLRHLEAEAQPPAKSPGPGGATADVSPPAKVSPAAKVSGRAKVSGPAKSAPARRTTPKKP